MALSFIVGRAGAGKTHYCLDRMARSGGKKSILLVPEQATFQMERAVHTLPGMDPAMAHVLSFRRLAYRVLSETGAPSLPVIDEVGKRMALFAIIDQLKSELQLFGRVAQKRGFVESLSGAIKELVTYQVLPDDLLSLLEADTDKQSYLARKLADLRTVYARYTDFLASGFADPDAHMSLFAGKVEASALLSGAIVWVDGFTGFTPQEITALMAVVRVAESVTVSLTLDPMYLKEPEPDGLFGTTLRTLFRLRRAAQTSGISLGDTLILPAGDIMPRFKSRDLAELERRFGRPGARDPRAPDDVAYLTWPNRLAEVTGIAEIMTSLVRENGYRWNDMAVLVHDISSYRDIFESVFGRNGIPVFIDSRKNVSYHPLIEFVRAAAEIIADGWPTDAVLRLLKTDLLPGSRESIDRLENFVLERGIKGSMWRHSSDWGDDVAEAVCNEALAIVLKSERSCERTVPGVIEAITKMLEELDVETKLACWADEAVARGRNEDAQLHSQALDGVLLVLVQAKELLARTDLGIQHLKPVLETGLNTLSLGIVPPSLDQVVVGSMDRSRHPRVRAVFIAGLVEGGFPGPVVQDPVFTDRDRERLLDSGIELGPTTVERIQTDEFLAYIALTRASERVYLTRPLSDDEGKALSESSLFDGLRRVFGGLKAASRDTMTSLTSPEGAIRALASGRETAVWTRAIERWFSERGRSSEIVFLREGRRRNDETPISPESALALYGLRPEFSVSRLEAFTACPFRHFAQYGLRLSERKLAEMDPSLAGTFIHAALAQLIRRLSGLDKDFSLVSQEELFDAAHASCRDALLGLQKKHLALDAATVIELMALEPAVRNAGSTLLEHARSGEFRPVGIELGFGWDERLAVPDVESDGEMRAQMVGRIDLVDHAAGDGRQFFRVIDFKSSGRDLAFDDILDGIDMQLAGYARAVSQNAVSLFGVDAMPAALLYLGVRESYTRIEEPTGDDRDNQAEESDGEDEPAEGPAPKRMSGLVLMDEEAARLMDRDAAGRSALVPVSFDKAGKLKKLKSTLAAPDFDRIMVAFDDIARESVQRISHGEVAISPWRKNKRAACDYCAYSPVCEFDTSRGSFRVLRRPEREVSAGGR